MNDLDKEWENYFNDIEDITSVNEEKNNNFSPKCSDIYISTRTKTGALDKTIDLEDIFGNYLSYLTTNKKKVLLKKLLK